MNELRLSSFRKLVQGSQYFLNIVVDCFTYEQIGILLLNVCFGSLKVMNPIVKLDNLDVTDCELFYAYNLHL